MEHRLFNVIIFKIYEISQSITYILCWMYHWYITFKDLLLFFLVKTSSSFLNRHFYQLWTQTMLKSRSIQRTQTPPRLWHLTSWWDLDLSSRSRKLMSLDAAYCIVPWYQVWCLWVYFTRLHHLIILCVLWHSPVTFSFCLGQWHFNHNMRFMLLNVCIKKEVCRFGRIWNMDIFIYT